MTKKVIITKINIDKRDLDKGGHMKKSKENHGITLVALIILIIVIAILVTISIYSGVGTIKYTRFMKIKTEMEILQANVNSWYEKYINGDESVLNYGDEAQYSEYRKEFLYVGAGETDAQNYRFFSPKYIVETLGIDGIENEYLISVKDRMVILVEGIVYQGNRYFIPDDFELTNIGIYETITSVNFDLHCGRNPKDIKEEVVFIHNIKFYDDSGKQVGISKFNIEYSKDGTNWENISSISAKSEYKGNEAYTIKATEDGSYIIKIKDRKGNPIKLTNNTFEKNIEVYNCSFPSFKNDDWQIYSPRQLRFLAEYVNNGYTVNEKLTNVMENEEHVAGEIKEITEDTTIFLMNDLDLGGRPGAGETDEEKWQNNIKNELVIWDPIGNGSVASGNYLKAEFDGQNNTIKGVYVNREGSYNGIIGNSDNNIKNLTIKDSYIKGTNCTGGIAGAIRSSRKVENCHNKNTTVILREGDYRIVGGIVGQLSAGTNGVFNCSNTGTVYAYGCNNQSKDCGGIVGFSVSEISNCSNRGNIFAVGEGNFVGGIVGRANSEIKEIKNCSNEGKVVGTECTYIGGIVGTMASKVGTTNQKLKKCYNSGEIEGKENVGGIAGDHSYIEGSLGDATVNDCYNKGKIIGTINVGQIIGNEQNNTGSNLSLKNLYYLENINNGLTAIGGVADTLDIRSTTDNFSSLEAFLSALDNNSIN